MNWYKHYIGDFQRDTGHLSLVQSGAYRSLIDHYYATEQPLPMDEDSLCRICRAHSKEERKAVMSVTRFFTEYNGAYWHKRIDAEIRKASLQAAKNREIAIARESKRAQQKHEPSNEPSTNRVQIVSRNGNVTRLPDLKATLAEEKQGQF